MTEFFQQYSFQILISIFIAIVGWIIKHYFASQKELTKSINGLGVRLTTSLDKIELDLRALRLEMKADIKEVSNKVDNFKEAEYRKVMKSYKANL